MTRRGDLSYRFAAGCYEAHYCFRRNWLVSRKSRPYTDLPMDSLSNHVALGFEFRSSLIRLRDTSHWSGSILREQISE
jgi:hypothetical protein